MYTYCSHCTFRLSITLLITPYTVSPLRARTPELYMKDQMTFLVLQLTGLTVMFTLQAVEPLEESLLLL